MKITAQNNLLIADFGRRENEDNREHSTKFKNPSHLNSHICEIASTQVKNKDQESVAF